MLESEVQGRFIGHPVRFRVVAGGRLESGVVSFVRKDGRRHGGYEVGVIRDRSGSLAHVAIGNCELLGSFVGGPGENETY